MENKHDKPTHSPQSPNNCCYLKGRENQATFSLSFLKNQIRMLF